MQDTAYLERRGQIEHYFDRTAAQTWARLTSDAPVGRIRATVREGRNRMRAQLLEWLPDDLSGMRVLDAGCGTGLASAEAARRGAEVVATDLSPTLIALARERAPADLGPGRIEFVAGDMLDPGLGEFDYLFAMDSLIHYELDDAVAALATLARRTRRAMVFTFAPRTAALAAMHATGRLFPRGQRAPAIVPVAPVEFARRLGAAPALAGWRAGRTERVACGFYTSQALEWTRA